MKIVIVSAMEKELEKLLGLVKKYEEKVVCDYKFYEAKYLGNDLIMTIGGIGKVQTGLILGVILSTYKSIDYLINLGVSGGVKGKVNPGDVVVGNRYSFADVDATFGGKFAFGEVPYLPRVYNANLDLIKDLNMHDFVLGDVLSGDTFFTSKEETDLIVNKYFSDLNVCAFDMESTAFAEGCYIHHISFFAIRAISDIIGGSGQVTEYHDYVHEASMKSAKLLLSILDTLKSD